MRIAKYRELETDEVAALEAFARAFKSKKVRSRGCDSWRDELSMIYWYNARIWNGPVAGMGNILHGIRNEFGPTWLYDVYKKGK
jgi:hypothetical protein